MQHTHPLMFKFNVHVQSFYDNEDTVEDPDCVVACWQSAISQGDATKQLTKVGEGSNSEPDNEALVTYSMVN